MKTDKLAMKYVQIVLLVLVMLLLTGCPGGDDLFATATEQYVMGWVLHNVDDSTPTVLNYSSDELAVYNYSFNYPGDSAQTYDNVLFWATPIVKSGGGGVGSSWKDIAVPLNRVYYVMGKNPVPENYRTNWSFANYMHINYIISEDEAGQFAYEVAQKEHYLSEWAFEAITPIPGDKRSVYFGTAPFTPTGIVVEDNKITLSDRLLKGYNDKSYLVRDTEIYVLTAEENFTYYLEKPRYKIYLNNDLVEENNLTTEWKTWNHEALNYSLSSDGNYSVEITIPSNYPLWNITKITSKFKKPSSDMNPPVLNHLEIFPRFETGQQQDVVVNVSDESGISEVKIYYDKGSGWISIPVNLDNSLYKSSFTINDASVDKINLKIFAKDNYENSIAYEIFSAAMKGMEVEFEFKLDSEEDLITRGSDTVLKGDCTDNLGFDCLGLLLKMYINGEYYDSLITDNYGDIRKQWKVPYDYKLDYINISLEFDGTGVYLPKEQSITKEIKIFNHDIGVFDIKVYELEFNKSGTITAKIFNLGRYNESNINVIFSVENMLVESLIIPELGVGEYYQAIFNWTPNVWGYIEIEISSQHILDEFDDNNIQTDYIKIYPEGPNINVRISVAGKTIVNQTSEIDIYINNYGTETATDATATLYDLYNCEFRYVDYGKTEITEYNNVEYEVTPNRIAHEQLLLNVKYNNQTEELILHNRAIGILNNGVILDIFMHNEDVSFYFCELEGIYSKSISDIEPGEYLTEQINWTPSILGEHRVKVFVNTTGEVYLRDNYGYDYAFVRIPGPDVYGSIWVDYPVLVDNINNITVYVYNTGTENVTDVTATVYEYEQKYEDETEIKVITNTIGSVYFGDFDVDEEKTEIIEWVPEEQRHYNLMLVVNASEDVDLENNYHYHRWIYARYDAPDINIYIEYFDNPIVNQTTPVELHISNYGTQTATDATATLYDLYNCEYKKLHHGETEIIEYNDIEYEITGDWLVDEYAILNITYNDQTEELFIHSNGIGILDNGIVVNLENIWGSYRIYFKLCELEGITTKDVLDIEPRYESTEIINWKPSIVGDQIIKVFVNTTEDNDWANNYYEKYTKVVLPGPNMKAKNIIIDEETEMKFIYEDTEMIIVNQSTTIGTVVENIGTEQANNVTVSLYLFEEEVEKPTEEERPEVPVEEVPAEEEEPVEEETNVSGGGGGGAGHLCGDFICQTGECTKDCDITVSGFQIKTDNNALEIGESLSAVVNSIGVTEMPELLANGTLSNEHGDFNYIQTLFMPNASVVWDIDPDDDDEIERYYLRYNAGTSAYSYNLDFEQSLKSDHNVNNTGYLDDIQGKRLRFLGKEYFVFKAKHPAQHNIRLTFMANAATDTISEGATLIYTLDGTDYEVTASFIGASEVFFTVNGEVTDKLAETETYRLVDGTEIGVNKILYNATGEDQVELLLGTGKISLYDSDTTSSGSCEVITGWNTLDNVKCDITTSSDDGTTHGADVLVSGFGIEYVPTDTLYVPPRGSTSAKAEIEEDEEGLFLNSFDIRYEFIDNRTELAEPIVFVVEDFERAGGGGGGAVKLKEEKGYLIGEHYVGDVEVNEEISLNFTLIPNSTGWKRLILRVNSSYDVDDENNEYYRSVRVRLNASDLDYYYWLPTNIGVNQTNILYFNLMNIGAIDAEDVYVEFFDNNYLFYDKTIGTMEVDERFRNDISWTPTYAGEHNITLHIKYKDNTGQHEIWDSRIVVVYENIDVLMTIMNPNGSYEPTYVDFDYYDFIYVTEPTQFMMPNITTDILFVNFFDEEEDEEGVAIRFEESELLTNMTAISNVYYNLTDGNLSLNVVYVNEVNWNYLFTEFQAAIPYLDFGITDPYNIILYQCSDFNFASESCANWTVADDYEAGKFSFDILFIEGQSNSRVEAFGIGS